MPTEPPPKPRREELIEDKPLVPDYSIESKHLRAESVTGAKIASSTYAGTADVANVDHAAESAGVAATIARGDHKHDVNPGVPGASAVADVAAQGSATTLALSDHKHGREAFASPAASAVGDTSSDGAATTVARSDHRHAREAFGSPAASAVGDTSANGAATTDARSDHRHAREAFGSPVAVGTANSAGTATTVPHSDHVHDASTLSPVGSVTAFAGAAAPTGWALCDGSSQLRAGAFAALFAVIGTTYGSVDGTHFNLPDLRGRTPVGQDAGTFAALGGTGGEETHTLIVAEMPMHNHGGNTSGPNHQIVDAAGTAKAATAAGAAWDTLASHTHVITSQGADAAHNNLQPYITLNYIIKT